MHSLCKLEEISPDRGKEVRLESVDGNRYIALFLVEGEVKGFINSCPHQGRSLSWAPDQFLFDDDNKLVCPHHGACFELKSGTCVSGPCEGASLTPVNIEIIDGMISLSEALAQGSANVSDSEA